MVVPSAETDFVSDFRRLNLSFTFLKTFSSLSPACRLLLISKETLCIWCVSGSFTNKSCFVVLQRKTLVLNSLALTKNSLSIYLMMEPTCNEGDNTEEETEWKIIDTWHVNVYADRASYVDMQLLQHRRPASHEGKFRSHPEALLLCLNWMLHLCLPPSFPLSSSKSDPRVSPLKRGL